MKIFATGFRGRVGKVLMKLGVLPFTCDVTDPDDVERAMKRTHYSDVIIHLAAIVDPDFCQIFQNMDNVLKVNVRGPFNVGYFAFKNRVNVVYVSTDQIFNGKGWFAGKYKEDAQPDPVNYYGRTKLAGESAGIEGNMKVVRTSYLFNKERLEDVEKENRDVPNFLRRSFMYVPHFAKSLYQFALQFDKMPPILNISGSDTVSWSDFMSRYGLLVGKTFKSRNKELPGFAPRPHKCGLNVSLSKKLGFPQYSYVDGLREMLDA